MDEVIQDHCGWCVASSLHDAYSFLKSLQHRGRETAGIAGVRDDGRIDVVKWLGIVDRFSLKNLSRVFSPHTYRLWLGHVRYATTGKKDPRQILDDAHPHVVGGTYQFKRNHLILQDCTAAIVHNGQVSHPSFDTTRCDSPQLLDYYLHRGIEDTLKNIRCAYSAAVADQHGVVVFRDVTGNRPAVLGLKDGRHCAASENMALIANGADPLGDIVPGSAHYIGLEEGAYTQKSIVSPERCHCMFEFQYLAGPQSTLDGINVRIHRERLGRILAKEFIPSDAHFVVYLPECPEPAARAYADESGIPFFDGVFYKMRAERSFQGSTLEERAVSIQENLHLAPDMREALRGKVVVLIDDSMVRANNIQHALDLLYQEAGVQKVYYVLYTPRIGVVDEKGVPRGCLYGVDMPPHDNFVVREKMRNLSEEELNKKVGATVHYISLDGMFAAFEQSGMRREDLCAYCVGGRGPEKKVY